MLTSLKRSMLLATLLAGVMGGQAYAQDIVNVKVPFAFVVSGHTFESGTYEVKADPDNGSVLLLCSGRYEKPSMFLMTTPASGHDPAGTKPALVFTHQENQYVLSQIWETSTEGRALSKS